ncbi:MAG: sodium:sulfate symporter family protein [Rhodospirillaceae bacterium]|nr:MAG: sodium:sulfate symporter family protein [Rhodospirillaceae bacterium]
MTSQTMESISHYIMSEPAFGFCPKADLARVLPHVKIRELKAGEELHVLGKPAAQSFLIVSGSFKVGGDDKGSGEGVVLSGGFLGEEAAIGLDTYVATVVATEPSKVIVLPRIALENLTKFKAFRDRLLASFSGRFVEGGKQHSSQEWLTVSKTVESPRLVLGWILTFLTPLATYFYFSTYGDLPNVQAVHLISIISATVMMWVFRLLPDFIPALFAVLCAILMGIAPPEIALKGFASDSFFMALSILGLSAVISVSGLSYRMLLLLLRVGPANKYWYNFSLFITGAFLTPIIPTTNGRTAIMTPFLTDLLNSMDKKTAKSVAPQLSVSLVSGLSLFSGIFLSSKSVNFVIFGMLPPQEQYLFQWLYWFYAASVVGGVLFVLFWIGSFLVFRGGESASIPKSVVKSQLSILGPVTASEWAGIVGLIALVMSFLTAALHRIEVPWIALAILFSLLMFGFLGNKDFRQRIDWSFLFFLGGLIGLVMIMRHVGLDGWLTVKLSWLGDYMAGDFFSFVLMLSAAMFVARLALPINATVIVFATFLIPTALFIGFNPWLVGFVILLMSESFVWPYQASYYAQFISIAGPAARTDDRRVALMQLLIFVFKLIAIYISIPFWQSLGIL